MADEVRGNTGVNVARCYQCGKCSAGCATAPEMDYPPSLVLRMLQTRSEENDRKVLGSNTIWLCLNCENCIARCPQQIDIPRMMDYLREESLRAGWRRRKGETGRGLPPGVPRLGEIHRTAVRGGTDRGIQGPDDAARTRPAPGAGHAGRKAS